MTVDIKDIKEMQARHLDDLKKNADFLEQHAERLKQLVEKSKVTTYNLSSAIINPQNDEPLKNGEKLLSVRDAIVTAFKMPTQADEKLSQDEINYRRKLLQKLAKCDEKEVALKSKSIEAIKEQARKYYIPGIAMQIFDVFDGEYSDATLEDI